MASLERINLTGNRFSYIFNYMETFEERKRILDEEIARLTVRGWTVKDRTDTTCFLVKEDRAMGCLSLVASFLVLFPFFNHHFKTRIIEVTPDGMIKRSRSVL